MSAAALLPEALSPAGPADWARPLVERQLQMLGRLAEAGLEIAVALEAQAKGGEAVVQGDVAMAYSRVARAVRQTIMLQSKLIEALQEHETGRAGRKAAARASAARIVRGVIDDDRTNDAERAERLAAEAAERLREEDFSISWRARSARRWPKSARTSASRPTGWPWPRTAPPPRRRSAASRARRPEEPDYTRPDHGPLAGRRRRGPARRRKPRIERANRLEKAPPRPE